MIQKRKLFVFNVDHCLDLITNSSSELFVLRGKTREIVEEMIKSYYPDYLTEYEQVKNITELSADELNTYFDYMCSPHQWPATRAMYPVPKGFTFDELYEPKDGGKPAWNNEVQYELRNNEGTKYGGFITEDNLQAMLDKFNPARDMWFLYSLDENPNWEKQEELMSIGDRYHLG